MNKHIVTIRDKVVYETIKKMIKDITPKVQGWLMKEEEYKKIAMNKGITKEFLNSREIEGISPIYYAFAMECKEIAEKYYKRYGLITVRQLYYQLVSRGIIQNNAASYGNFDGHLTKARESGLIDDVFEDRSRKEIIPNAISINTNIEQYLKEELESALLLPSIDRWDGQFYYVELWIEKDALVKLFEPIAKEKQVILFPSRGYTSITKIREARKRFELESQAGKKCIILYAGDLDPAGWDIYENLKRKFKELVEVKRFALNPDQIEELNLIPMPVKKTDTKHEAFCERFPELDEMCYELDAMDPEALQKLAVEMVDEYFNITLLDTHRIASWEGKFKEVSLRLLEKIAV